MATLAFLETTTTPRALPPDVTSRLSSTLGPAKWDWVYMPAAVAG